MKPDLKRLPARFYRSDMGREPVRQWLKDLDPADRKAIGEDIKDLEFSWPIGMPLVRSLGRESWEVRSSFAWPPVLLQGFVKKSRKTPQHDVDLAIERKKGGRA